MRKYFTFLLVLCFIVSYAQQNDIKTLTTKAEQGDPQAQSNLGIAYENGYGVEKSDEKAVYWWQKAAEQGHAEAQYNLGYCYYNGKGIELSKSKATYWFIKACDNSNDKACYALNKIMK